MIIDQTTTEVFGVDPTEFKIVASSKAFKILGDSLYQNKQEAVVRELSTNALDAQKEAVLLNHMNCIFPRNLMMNFAFVILAQDLMLKKLKDCTQHISNRQKIKVMNTSEHLV